jgi:hypothetical protein
LLINSKLKAVRLRSLLMEKLCAVRHRLVKNNAMVNSAMDIFLLIHFIQNPINLKLKIHISH